MNAIKVYFGGVLQHEYDPVKAKEYYERTKQLKGRQAGQANDPRNRDRELIDGPSNGMSDARREEIAARVDALKEQLKVFRAVLKRLVDEAKKRSGLEVDEEEDEGSEPSNSDSESESEEGGKKKKSESEKLTASEKRKKAKAAKEAYIEENPGSEIAEIQKKLDEVTKKIEAAKRKLARQANGSQI